MRESFIVVCSTILESGKRIIEIKFSLSLVIRYRLYSFLIDPLHVEYTLSLMFLLKFLWNFLVGRENPPNFHFFQFRLYITLLLFWLYNRLFGTKLVFFFVYSLLSTFIGVENRYIKEWGGVKIPMYM